MDRPVRTAAARGKGRSPPWAPVHRPAMEPSCRRIAPPMLSWPRVDAELFSASTRLTRLTVRSAWSARPAWYWASARSCHRRSRRGEALTKASAVASTSRCRPVRSEASTRSSSASHFNSSSRPARWRRGRTARGRSFSVRSVRSPASSKKKKNSERRRRSRRDRPDVGGVARRPIVVKPRGLGGRRSKLWWSGCLTFASRTRWHAEPLRVQAGRSTPSRAVH